MSSSRSVRKDLLNTFCQRYDAGEKFDKEELLYIVHNCDALDEVMYGNHFWEQIVQTIFECGGRLFSITRDVFLHDGPVSEFCYDPVEVRKVQCEKTVTVTVWQPVERESC